MKFNITQTLINYIKDLRKERGIKNKELSKAMGKTDSYITKLDGGGIKTIDLEDFDKLFAGIESDPNKADKLKDDYFLLLIQEGLINNSLPLKIDLHNYAHVCKKLEPPTDVIKHLNRILSRNNRTINEVVSLLNRNIPEAEYYGYSQAPENEYIPIPAENAVSSDREENHDSYADLIYMKLHLDPVRMAAIMSGKVSFVYYYEIQALALGILTYEYAQYRKTANVETIMQNADDYNAVSQSSAALLFNLHFYSLADTRRIERSKKRQQKATEALMLLPHSIQDAFHHYISLTDRIYKQDEFYTEAKMARLGSNLDHVPSLVFAVNGLPLYKLKEINAETKRAFLSDLEKLIDKYASDSSGEGELELL